MGASLLALAKSIYYIYTYPNKTPPKGGRAGNKITVTVCFHAR